MGESIRLLNNKTDSTREINKRILIVGTFSIFIVEVVDIEILIRYSG